MSTPFNCQFYLKNLSIFMQELCKNPRHMGAICPSSRFLGAEIAKHVSAMPNAKVLQLGVGTGVITKALLKSGIKPEQIIGIEYSAALIERFKLRLPHIKVIHGDALHMRKLLGQSHDQVAAVVNCLPLKIFPLHSVQSILEQVKEILQANGCYTAFTYRFAANTYEELHDFKKIYSKWVWLNIPPARVDVYSI